MFIIVFCIVARSRRTAHSHQITNVAQRHLHRESAAVNDHRPELDRHRTLTPSIRCRLVLIIHWSFRRRLIGLLFSVRQSVV